MMYIMVYNKCLIDPMMSKSTHNQSRILKVPTFPLGVPVLAKFKNWKHPKEGIFTQKQWCGNEDDYSYSFHWGPHDGPFYSQQSRQAFPYDNSGDRWIIQNVPEVWLPNGEKWDCFE